MIWLILFLAVPGIVWAAWITIIETAHEHLMSWPATIFAFIVFVIMIIAVSILILFLCTNIALASNVEIEPQELIKTTESEDKILVIDEPGGTVCITYYQKNKLSATKIEAHLSTVEIHKSPNNKNYIEVYTATWASSIRRFLYGKFVPEEYYIIYMTGD